MDLSPIKLHSLLASEVLTTGQVAGLFGVNFKTVLRWAKEGRLPACRLPGKRRDFRFTKTQVLEFAMENQLQLMIARRTERSLVLVVDDDPMIARSIERVLHGLCHVIHASDGYQAGIFLVLCRPQLIFLDLQMPKVDGVLLLQFMRKNEALKETPVCLITGAHFELIQKALDAGANAFLEKPFQAEQIRAAAAKLIFKENKRRAA